MNPEDMNLFPRSTGAEFSDCKTYRYKLWRTWDKNKKPVMFLMLNPSVADDVKNDPTVERCERRARLTGAGGLLVGNIFALRSTDPVALYNADDPVGPLNDNAIMEMAGEAEMVVCAWGNHGAYAGRGKAVARLLAGAGILMYHFGLTVSKQPRHPLYVSYMVQPTRWNRGLL